MNKNLLLLALCALPLAAQVEFRPEPSKVAVIISGQHATTFHYESKWDKPFLHPLKTPSGVVVSRGFPVETMEGDSTDHTWQRGLWYGGEISGADFWRERGPDHTGRLVLRGEPRFQGATLSVVTDMVAPGGRNLGSIVQEFAFRRDGPSYFIDATITLQADQGRPVKIEDSEECCLGVRLAEEFREDRGAALRNSEGQTGTSRSSSQLRLKGG